MLSFNTPSQLRALIRNNQFKAPTPGTLPGIVQTNLVILPKVDAQDFARFCELNPKPCPVVEQLPAGQSIPNCAPDADLRTDLAYYRIYQHGELIDEVTDINALWQDDFVSFLLGCSFSFEDVLIQQGIPVRHLEQNCNVSMYTSNIPTQAAGQFSGPMVVSMRPIPKDLVEQAIAVTEVFTQNHGAPVHVANPALIGIEDLAKTDFGDPVNMMPGDVPVFWACGVTPQVVAQNAKPKLMITHRPGYMFVTDSMA